AKGMALDPDEVNRMLDDYYEARGWDRKTGVPTEAKIMELGLEDEWSTIIIP
ncbi:MAG: hypothetical protein JW950_14255, partial [Deltaproteobacteria bacterium]|nr:hypothetical protein [Deltaproteobacteria bacterium]